MSSDREKRRAAAIEAAYARVHRDYALFGNMRGKAIELAPSIVREIIAAVLDASGLLDDECQFRDAPDVPPTWPADDPTRTGEKK